MLYQKETIDNDVLDSPLKSDNQFSPNGRNRILNDSSVFYKGLIGMILCIVPAAIVGLILIKISLEQAKIATKVYNDNPGTYRFSSINMVKRGRMFAYVGLTLFIIEIIALVMYMSIN